MSITNAARRFEQRFDAKAERFIWHHPLLGFISIFVGMPLLVWRVSVSVRSLSSFLILGTAKKEDESYANANCTHRCMCGSNAAVVCLYFNEGR